MVPKANTKWYYRVSAINPEGVGKPSVAATASTLPAVAPLRPTGLVAWENGPTRIVLVWQAPAATGGEITGYKIEHSVDGEDPWMDLVANTMRDATTYTDTSVPVGTARHYRVSAINSAGTSTPVNEDETSAETGTEALKAPTSLLAQKASQRAITLTWTVASSGDEYLVERSEDGSTGWASISDTPVLLGTDTFRDEDGNLELNTTYYYRVSTTATAPPSVRSRPSNVANARTGPVEVPRAPTLVNTNDDNVDPRGPSRIDLTWVAPENNGGGEITGYRIEYSDDDDDDPPANTWRVLVANTMSVAVMYEDHGSVAELELGDQRHYRVYAINSAGRGAASASARNGMGTPEVPEEEPGAPTGLTARATGPMEIELSWTAPEDTSGAEITGYKIEYANLGDEGTGATAPAFGNWAVLDMDTGDDDTTFTDDGSTDDGSDGTLEAETTRRYRVTALNVVNNGDDNNSNVASATTHEATVPGMPTGLMLTPAAPEDAQHKITLTSWVAPVNTGGTVITGYRIERSENGSSWETLVEDTSKIEDAPTVPPYIDMMVPKANTRWHYRVSAINSEGAGMPSAAATASTFPVVAP